MESENMQEGITIMDCESLLLSVALKSDGTPVWFSPLNPAMDVNSPKGSSVTVNVSGNVLSQDFVEGELAESIKEAVRRGTDFGIS